MHRNRARILTGFYQDSQNPVSCSHMNCCLQKYTKHQFTYFTYYLFQDILKYPKIIKIQQVQQEIHAKQFFIILFKLFSIGDSFKFKATQETRLI